MVSNNDKLLNFLKSGKLDVLSVGRPIEEIVNIVGLPDGYASVEALTQDMDQARTEARDLIVVGYASIQVYVEPRKGIIEDYIIERGFYFNKSMPNWLVKDGWKNIFDSLFRYSPNDLRRLLESNSIQGEKKVVVGNYLTVIIVGSDVSLNFCGDDGVDGLCKIGIDLPGESLTVPW